ncbi:MAG: hypothetical protein M3Y80_04780 [Verrucomicrobiota bacterium]|nr:hypothetical protein [Verrucomicrobiota bacterium]
MNLRPTVLLALAISAPLIAGCTTTTTTTAQTTKRKDVELTTEKRSYSQAELQKRGRQTVGESLAAEDASISVSHGR